MWKMWFHFFCAQILIYTDKELLLKFSSIHFSVIQIHKSIMSLWERVMRKKRNFQFCVKKCKCAQFSAQSSLSIFVVHFKMQKKISFYINGPLLILSYKISISAFSTKILREDCTKKKWFIPAISISTFYCKNVSVENSFHDDIC